MRILLFGFSVTEAHNSYARQAKGRLEASGHTVDVCGMGGIHPDHAAYILPIVLKRARYDLMVLEILTSAYRVPGRNVVDYLWPVSYMLDACLRAGARPVVLALTRGDVDLSADKFWDATQQACARVDAPRLDLRALLMPYMGDRHFMKDVVHPTDPGNEIQLQAFLEGISPYLTTTDAVDPHRCVWPEAALQALDLTTLPNEPCDLPVETYSRPGIAFSARVVPAGVPLVLTLPAPVQVNGLGFLMGPRTGRFHIDDAHGQRRSVLAYDEYCYYERFHARLLAPMRTDRLTIAVDADIPELPLKKGEADTGPRLGKFCHAYVSSRPLPELMAGAGLL